MKVKAQVVSERVDVYQGKRGQVQQRIVSLLEVEKDFRFLNTFDYVMTEDEAKKFGGTLQDKVVGVGIVSMEPAFGGRMRAKGGLIMPEK